MRQIDLLDSTLRDGAQSGGIAFSVEDKLQIVEILDSLGIPFLEAGNPGSNPKDLEFFRKAAHLQLRHTRLVAFGSTVRKGEDPMADSGLRALLEAGTEYCSVFGKSSLLHVEKILQTTPEENLRMIRETCRYLAGCGRKVLFDAEHFFDGYQQNAQYALQTVDAAVDGGACGVVLCDTNGGQFPQAVAAVTAALRDHLPENLSLGVHFHNDCGLAVANTMAAVDAGADHVQGTYLGFGERCGNADLSTLIPNLQYKQAYACIPPENLVLLHAAAVKLASVANIKLPAGAPYVGSNAVRHKAGMHADGVMKLSCSFEHIDPEIVGNQRRFPASEMSGRKVVFQKIRAIYPDAAFDSQETAEVLRTIKQMERDGYQFEDCDASFELLVRRRMEHCPPFFELINYNILSAKPSEPDCGARATVKVRVGNQVQLMAAEGNGPVHALDQALRAALEVFYPVLAQAHLIDYKVRVLDAQEATAAKVRVLITSTDGDHIFTTMGVSGDVVEASWAALSDSIAYALLKWQQKTRNAPQNRRNAKWE